MSKGMKEKVQLCLVMAREAKLYLLDEPIGGVDPAARDYILETIINNYNEDSTIIISTHLIADIEKVLDYVIYADADDRAGGFKQREALTIVINIKKETPLPVTPKIHPSTSTK